MLMAALAGKAQSLTYELRNALRADVGEIPLQCNWLSKELRIQPGSVFMDILDMRRLFEAATQHAVECRSAAPLHSYEQFIPAEKSIYLQYESDDEWLDE